MAPATGQFDIYQSAVGVTAVTSPVQRQILEALGEQELQLPEIVALTGKAKSTLSSIHMKELLNRELIEELPHPTDSRRKVYRLIGRPLRSSEAAKGTAPTNATPTPRAGVPHTPPAVGTGVPLAAVFQVLAEAPTGAEAALQAQAQALGRHCANRMAAPDAAGFATALTRFVEEERLAQHLQLDFEAPTFRCRPGPAVPNVSPERMGLLLAAFAEGAAAGNGLDGFRLLSSVDGDAFMLAPNRS